MIPPTPKIVAFLQCQWIKKSSLVTVEAMYRRHGRTPEGRAMLNAGLLFYKSLSGRRLKNAFGPLVDRIIWEECTMKIATESSGAFPADLDHMRDVIQHFNPSVVLTFGTIAGAAINNLPSNFTVIKGCHPTARNSGVVTDLALMADRLKLAITPTYAF